MTTRFEVHSMTSHDDTVMRYGVVRASDETAPMRNPVVYVPGLGGSVKTALDFLERFIPASYGPVYSLDARGFGLNENLAPTPKPGLYTADLDRFVQHLETELSDKPPVILGISLGAILSVEYLLRYEHPFAALMMFAPAFSPNPEMFSLSFKFRNYMSVLTRGLRATTTLPYNIQHLTRHEERRADPELQEPLTLPTLYLLLVERLCERAFRNISRLDIPAAVVMPQKDLVCDPVAMRKAYDRLPSSKKVLLTYPELYHDVMMEPEEDQEQIITDLSHWLDTLKLSSKETVRH